MVAGNRVALHRVAAVEASLSESPVEEMPLPQRVAVHAHPSDHALQVHLFSALIAVLEIPCVVLVLMASWPSPFSASALVQ